MSYEDRIASARTHIELHNQAIGEGNPGFLPIDNFMQPET